MTIRDGQERVAKLIAQKGWCSRREAERLISGGQVLVAGKVVRDQGLRVAVDAEITLKDRGKQHLAELVTVIMNKPTGIVSTQPEGDQVPAWQLLTPENCLDINAEGVDEVLRQPWTCAVCGRLDQNSRGLLVLSQDGKLARLITAGGAWKKYYDVSVRHPVTPEHLKQLLKLRRLDEETIQPMDVRIIAPKRLLFVLQEGRKHQIRRACAAVDLTVTDLIRHRVGPWELADCPEGKWRVVPRADVIAYVSDKREVQEPKTIKPYQGTPSDSATTTAMGLKYDPTKANKTTRSPARGGQARRDEKPSSENFESDEPRRSNKPPAEKPESEKPRTRRPRE